MPRAAAPLPLARRALLAAACGPASRRSTSSASTSSVFSPPSAQLQPVPPSSGDALGEHASPFALPEPFAASARRSAAPGEHELDILTMVREMEASGLSRGQAETVARAVAANSGELWQRCGARFAERLDLEKHEHANRAALKVFRAEMENRLSEMKVRGWGTGWGGGADRCKPLLGENKGKRANASVACLGRGRFPAIRRLWLCCTPNGCDHAG